MNAVGFFASSKCDHITPLLRQLHWLKVPWGIDYKLALLVYKSLHGLAPSYLADEFHNPTDSEFRKRLRSASSHELSVPRTRLSTYGDRTPCLLLSLEDILLRTLLLPVITVVVPAK